MLKLNFDPKIQKIVLVIVRDLFVALSFIFYAFGLAEIFKPGIFLNYINLTAYLAVVFFLGIVTILFYPQENREIKKIGLLDYATIILLSILFGTFVIYFLRSLGVLSILVGICSVIICYFFTILIFKQQ